MSKYKIQENECYWLTEASSSQTGSYFFKHNYSTQLIQNNTKISILEPMDLYAKNDQAEEYYNIIYHNDILREHIISSNCSKYHWSILSTGGMRNLEDTHGKDLVDDFYSRIKTLHEGNEIICNGDICKEIVLNHVKTINGKDEGFYAWNSFKHTNNEECHAVFDLGGQTAQYTNQTFVYTQYIGRQHSLGKIHDTGISQCFNRNNTYHGDNCREVIKNYLSTSSYDIPILTNSHCKLYAVSNFYYFFKDLCTLYLPSMQYHNYTRSPIIDDICARKSENLDSGFSVQASHYKSLADEICQYQNSEWNNKTAETAAGTCFIGNYIHQVLEHTGLLEEKLTILDADWTLGAVDHL
ncbi:MAG: hypothetical protein AABY27_06755 [Pseudomonadota bacterium]